MFLNKSEYQLFPGNNGKTIECCCDECSYMMCCTESFSAEECEHCTEQNCPRFPKQGQD